MANHVLTKTFVAGAAIDKYAAVKFDSADDTVIAATAATDLPVGVAIEAAAAAGDRIDVAVMGIAEVTAAGTITRGQFVTPTTAGAVVALAAAATIKNAVGKAMVTAASGDVFDVLLSPWQAVTA